MPLFEFRIIDKHETQEFDDNGSLICKPSGEWLVFDFALEISEVTIISFRTYILFDQNDNIKECTKVILSDGSYLFAVNKYNTFKRKYNEVYLPLFREE